MKIVFASRNKNKIREMEEILRSSVSEDIKVLSLDDIGFTGDIEETGLTFEENAKIKAAVPASMGYYAFADDSGLAVDALGGQPGVHSARYAGIHGDTGKNNIKLLAALADLPAEKRTARFVSVIAFAAPAGEEDKNFTVRGECEGTITFECHGNNGFGYDPLFFYEPLGKTFAELSAEEKNAVSHRGKAMRMFAEKLKEKKGI